MEPLPSTTDNKLTSDRLKAFEEALAVVYIKRNASGRLKFAAEWPEAAQYILGPELMGFDRTGTSDKALRAQLEDAAEQRRYELLQIVETIEEKSAERGVLKMEYVQDVLSRLGRSLGLLIYAPRIVNKFLPPDPAEMIAQAPVPELKTEPVHHEPTVPAPAEILPVIETPADTSRFMAMSPMIDKDLEKTVETDGGPNTGPALSALDSIQPISLDPAPVQPTDQSVVQPLIDPVVQPVIEPIAQTITQAIIQPIATPLTTDPVSQESSVIAPMIVPVAAAEPPEQNQPSEHAPAQNNAVKNIPGRLKIFGIKDGGQ